jgi:tryptophan synthase alpha chain
LAAPTTSERRLHHIVSGARGFLYYVAVAGVTGVQSATPEAAKLALAQLRRATGLPIALGFGVRSAAAAAGFAQDADAVVVGSALVDAVGAGPAAGAAQRVGDVVRELAEAVHAARGVGEDGGER